MPHRRTLVANALRIVGLLLLLHDAPRGGLLAFAQSVLLNVVTTRYYSLHSDLQDDELREARLRIDLMAEEYARRTRSFAGTINRKLPVYMFTKRDDYVAAGGSPNSVGVYTHDKLLVWAGPDASGMTWRTMQHEGFHQFAHSVIGGNIPPWVDEGLAEYFGDALFTGDGYVTGGIPPMRLAYLRHLMKEEQLVPARRLLTLEREIWNTHVTSGSNQAGPNYQQAWSMVYFLAHAENGRYREAFDRFIREVSTGQQWDTVWMRVFGGDPADFEQRWREYWIGLPQNPTERLYAEATVATMTSYFARAFSRRQQFEDAREFFDAARAGTLASHPNDWLPPSLLARELKRVDEVGEWSIERRTGQTRLVCTLSKGDGAALVGTFKIENGRVKPGSITVTRETAPKQRIRR